jgi:two-component system cell cycle sensor histidine kinase/response regulator CckA
MRQPSPPDLSAAPPARLERSEDETLRRHLALLRLLQTITATVNDARSVEDAFQAALDEVCAFTGWELGHVYTVNAAGEVEPADIWHRSGGRDWSEMVAASSWEPCPPAWGLPGRVIWSGGPIWISDLLADERFTRRAAAEAVGLRLGAAFPVLVGAEVAAVLEFFGSRPAVPDPELIDTLSQVGILLGRAVERKRAETALRESEEHHRLLFEANPCPMWVHDAQTLEFLAVNEAAVEQYGYSRAEFERMTILDIRPPEDAEVVGRLAREPGPLRGHPSRHCRKDGSVIDVEISSQELSFRGRPARLVLAQDQTERRAAERARERLIAVLDATPDLIAISSQEGPITYLNPAGRRMLGIEDPVGLRLIDHRPEWASRLITDEALPAALREGQWSGETAFLGPDGTEIPVLQAIIAHRDPGGHVEFFSTIARDVSEWKELEGQLRQSQKMEAVGRLAGGVAHDFNNMLSVINGYAELLLVDMPPDDVKRRGLEEIRRAGARSAELTRQLLAFSRRQLLTPTVLDLRAVLRELEPMLRGLLGESIRLVTLHAPLAGKVRFDRSQLEQVLINLAINARDAMPDGGQLSISVERAVRAEGDPPCGLVRITVADAGIGMDPSTQARVFEPFFTTKAVGEGTGLGLSTVHGIVEQSGGRIYVESEPGRGTTFRIDLPRVDESAP